MSMVKSVLLLQDIPLPLTWDKIPIYFKMKKKGRNEEKCIFLFDIFRMCVYLPLWQNA